MGGRKSDTVEIIKARVLRSQWVVLLPILIYFIVFLVVPISRLFYRSFWDPQFTLKNYIHFFTEPVYIKVIINSFKIGLSVTLISLFLGYPYAYLLSSTSERVANKLLIFVIISLWVSLLVRNYAWIVLLGRNGVFNSLLLDLGLISKPLKLVYNNAGTNIGMVHIMLPYMVLCLYSVMKGIDRNLLKAAQSLGANRFRVFVRIFLPLSLPGVAAGCLIVFIMAIGFFITPALLGGPRDAMIAQLIEQQVNLVLNWGLGFAASLVLLVLTIVILLVYNRFLGLDKLWGGIKV